MTASNTLCGKPSSFEYAVFADSFDGILGTGRSVATSWWLEGRDTLLVETNQPDKGESHNAPDAT